MVRDDKGAYTAYSGGSADGVYGCCIVYEFPIKVKYLQ